MLRGTATGHYVPFPWHTGRAAKDECGCVPRTRLPDRLCSAVMCPALSLTARANDGKKYWRSCEAAGDDFFAEAVSPESRPSDQGARARRCQRNCRPCIRAAVKDTLTMQLDKRIALKDWPAGSTRPKYSREGRGLLPRASIPAHLKIVY